MKELGFSNFHGKRLNKADRIEGKTPFVTAGFDNRGIAQRIGNNLPIYQKAITVDMFGNCFFQADDCTGDDNVYFFINDDISEFCKLFISTCIHTVTSKLFAYVEQFRQSDANTLSVKLPVDVKGNPDWDYMENYMKKTMTECKHSLSASEMAI